MDAAKLHSVTTRKAVAHLKRGDAVLRALIERIGPFEMKYLEPEFQTLARSIVFQQLNGRAASTIFNRLLALSENGRLEPEWLLRARVENLREAGLSAQKAAYLKDLAGRTVSGEIDFPALVPLDDREVIASLTRVKGVGVWTAQMFLIFALRRPDVLPVADYGLRSAIRNVYSMEDLPDAAAMEERARPWRPWASAACWYLWRSLDGPAGL